MARYIDAEKVIEKIVNTPSMLPYEYELDEKALSLLAQRQNEILDIVEMNVPTENVAPVIHARWKWKLADNGWADTTCSNCGHVWNMDVHMYLDYDYCPYCGAMMDEEEQ